MPGATLGAVMEASACAADARGGCGGLQHLVYNCLPPPELLISEPLLANERGRTEACAAPERVGDGVMEYCASTAHISGARGALSPGSSAKHFAAGAPTQHRSWRGWSGCHPTPALLRARATRAAQGASAEPLQLALEV